MGLAMCLCIEDVCVDSKCVGMQGACIQNGQTFRVDIESFGKKVSNEYRLDVFKRLAVIPFDSQVKLKVWIAQAKG